MKCSVFIIFLIIAAFQLQLAAQEFIRTTRFDDNWKFYRGKTEGAENPGFDDSKWRALNLPHDWSIEDLPASLSLSATGPFDANAIGGTHTGFTSGGTGWYRKHFLLPEALREKIVTILFDGIYMNADIWINGFHLGNHPYGYTPFWYDISRYLYFGKQENVIAVQVKNEGDNSRWYSGSGIYRHVVLTITDKMRIVPWGVFISTTSADSSKAELNLVATVENRTTEKKQIQFNVEIVDPESRTVSSKKMTTLISHSVQSKLKFQITVLDPQLWSIDSPSLYKAVCTIFQGDSILDVTETTFGIRSLRFDTERGFFLNGQHLKLKGGALHADNGPLGAVAFDRAEERRVELMKQAGFNTIRTAHNPPSSAFLDACDRLGMLVVEEAFDVWNVGWRPDDYQVYFKDHWKQDLTNMILRDRNHPAIIDWGIGNQIREARDSSGVALAYEMTTFVHSLDVSRPVSANVAMNIRGNWHDGSPKMWQEYDPIFAALDVCGYSYQSSQYVTDHQRLPDRIMLSTEIDPRNCFSNWMRATDNPFVLGNITWTAMDYMGEVASGWYDFTSRPSSLFPWYASYTGDMDVCGFRRPRSYYRDILFNHSNKLSCFVLAPVSSFDGKGASLWGWDDVKPSWTWPGYEGKELTVVAYSACDSVQLLLNDKVISTKNTSRATEFKAAWQVPYIPGTLKTKGYLNGAVIAESKLQTASTPARIHLSADRTTIEADGQDLSFVTVEITDKFGVLHPQYNDLINFRIEGEGTIEAVGNSNPRSVESFKQPFRKAYEGKCLVVVRSNKRAGQIILQATGKGLTSEKIIIHTKTTTKSQEIRYLDNNIPGLEPKIYAPDIISLKDRFEHGISIQKNGSEHIIGLDGGKYWTYNGFLRLKRDEKGMLTIDTLHFADHILRKNKSMIGGEPNVTQNNREMYFVTDYPTDIWRVSCDRNGKWYEPVKLDTAVNSIGPEWFPVIASDNCLYFARDTKNKVVIYKAEKVDGVYKKVSKIDAAFNYDCGDMVFSKKMDYIVFASPREGGFGNTDLYIAFKKENGEWTDGINLGPNINTKGFELAPYLSPDDKFLFFTRRDTYGDATVSDIYWVSLDVISKKNGKKDSFIISSGI